MLREAGSQSPEPLFDDPAPETGDYTRILERSQVNGRHGELWLGDLAGYACLYQRARPHLGLVATIISRPTLARNGARALFENPEYPAGIQEFVEVDDKVLSKTDMMQALWGKEHGILERIHDALEGGQDVFVHCEQGASRSATVVMAYIMKYRQDIGKYI
ncbi:unnamed protein product [Prorocentrum cordatum]|uniref:Tyrosine specific protein phosphatases domain-containing protein n=1 Tax=Prorocentrum cordatum TaxID=2364126 RepID=A0ABN9VAV9_9DINO|nr:unnamed protein product [Polarella glacialis]